MPLTVHLDQELGELNKFWRATGFASPTELLRPACRAQLAMAARDPGPGIEHVRIHYLLNLVEAPGLLRGEPDYDWSRLDAALDALVSLGMKPFFELMGNPSGVFSDFNDPVQLDSWRRLVRDLIRHLFNRYDQTTVRSWYFETWNEPDCDTWWKQFNQDPPSLCKYYDACAAGLADAGGGLTFGGPGGSGGLSRTVLAFLEHCDHGRDRYTDGPTRKPDFLSLHEKGGPMTEDHVDPELHKILEGQLRFVDHVREHCPRLRDVPVMNNEADPQIGWHLPHPWRASAYYPAFAIRLIELQIEEVLTARRVPLAMVVNDNGFVGGWGNRTLTTLLGDPEAQDDSSYKLLPKPIFHGMTLLNALGPTRLAHDWEPDETEPQRIEEIGALPTRRADGRLAVLLSRFTDAWRERSGGTVTLHLPALAAEGHTARVSLIRDTAELDHAATLDPRDPALREPDQLDRLRRATALESFDAELGRHADGGGCLKLDLPLPGVALVEIDPTRP